MSYPGRPSAPGHAPTWDGTKWIDLPVADPDQLPDKHPARLASTEDIGGTYNPTDLTLTGSSALPQFDNTTANVNDRILLKDQDVAKYNGIFVVTQATDPWILTRAEDFSANADVYSGVTVSIDEGESQAGETWFLSTIDPIALDTTPLVFSLINAGDLRIPGQTAGDILYFNGTHWSRVPRGSGLQTLVTGGAPPHYVPGWFDPPTDNATALRPIKSTRSRFQEQNVSASPPFLDWLENELFEWDVFPDLGGSSPGLAGQASVIVGDKLYLAGAGAHGGGYLWGLDLYGPQPASTGYITSLDGVPAQMVGLRGTQIDPTTNPPYRNFDYLCLMFQTGGFAPSGEILLGFITGTTPSVGWTQIYDVSMPSRVSPQAICHVGGGSVDPKYTLTGTFGEGSVPVCYPWFAISASDGHIYILDASGALTSDYATGEDIPVQLVYDQGYLWVYCSISQTLLKLAFNPEASAGSRLSLVLSTPVGGEIADLKSDGRYIRALMSIAGNMSISAWDLQSGAPVQPLVTEVPLGASVFTRISDFAYDIGTDNIWMAQEGGFSELVVPFPIAVFNDTSEEFQFATAIGSGSGELPATWGGVERLITDGTYVYAAALLITSGANPIGAAALDVNTGEVVGLFQTNGASGGNPSDLEIHGDTLYVVYRYFDGSTYLTSTIQAFSVSAAVAAYPTPVTPTATTPTARAYTSVCYDPVTNRVFANTFNQLVPGQTEYLVSLNPSSLADVAVQSLWVDGAYVANVTNSSGLFKITTSENHNLTTGNTVTIAEVGGNPCNGTAVVTVIDPLNFTLNGSTFSGSYVGSGFVTLGTRSTLFFTDLLASAGAVWVGMATSTLYKINPSTFPASGSITPITTSVYGVQDIRQDSSGPYLLLGDNGNNGVSRVDTSTNAEVSFFATSGGAYLAIGGSAEIWTANTSGGFTPTIEVQTYTNTVGSETLIDSITGYPEGPPSGQMAWDGESFYVLLPIDGTPSGDTHSGIPNVYRIHPDSGEILLSLATAGVARGLALDSNGGAYVTNYSPSGPDHGVHQIYELRGGADDPVFNSIRRLDRPLQYQFGGHQVGFVELTSSGGLDAQHMTALAHTSSGSINVVLLDTVTSSDPMWLLTVMDVDGDAATNNITVNGGGNELEDPGSPGTYDSSVTLSTNSTCVTWVWLPTLSVWKVWAKF